MTYTPPPAWGIATLRFQAAYGNLPDMADWETDVPIFLGMVQQAVSEEQQKKWDDELVEKIATIVIQRITAATVRLNNSVAGA